MWEGANECPMSVSGQKRSWRPRTATSGLPRTMDINGPARLVRFVPIREVAIRKHSFHEAQVGSERFYFVRAQGARHHGHRRCGAGMISLAPLLKPPFQIGIGQSTQARNVSDALGIGAMAGVAGHDVGLWNSLHINGAASGNEVAIPVVGGPWRQGGKINGEVTRFVGTQSGDGAPHIL